MIRKSGSRFSLATNAKRLRGDHAPTKGAPLPRRTKSKAKEKRHRRLIGIRPIVIRSVVIIRLVVRAVRIVPDMPGATPRAEVGRLQLLTCMDAGFRVGRGGTAWRNRPNQRQSRCEDGASNPCLHASAPRTNSSATQDRPAACGPVSPRTQAAGITSGASGDDGADDNPSGGGGANGGGASALGW